MTVLSNNEPLRLEALEALPSAIFERIEEHKQLFQHNEYLESVLEHSAVSAIAEDLENYLRQQRIIGYHCTKEPHEGFFAARGLRTTDVLAHQQEFLSMFGNRFTAEEIAEMESTWHSYFVEQRQRTYRDGLIWTCLSRSLVKTRGTETFFRFFGGEAIFMPLKESDTLAEKLESIGTPVVVEVVLPGDSLTAYYPMSRAVLSQYHIRVNPNASLVQSEAKLPKSIPPEDVISVTPLKMFRP